MITPPTAYLIVAFSSLSWCKSIDTEMPKFLRQPPRTVVFSNDTGTQISCFVTGRHIPRVSWLMSDGSQAITIPGIREVLSNGSVFFPPFSGMSYSPEVHRAVYRCRAETSLGVLLSPDVDVRAVVRSDWWPRVTRTPVLPGNTAVLVCSVPSDSLDFILHYTWYIDESIVVTKGIGDSDEKVTVAARGTELHLRNVRSDDSRFTFSCATVDKFTGERKRSEPSSLIITDASGNMPPRIIRRPPSETSVELNSPIELICIAQGNPTPSIEWFREVNGRHESVGVGGMRGRYRLERAEVTDGGRWGCRAQSSLGEQQAITLLHVIAPLKLAIHPDVMVVNFGNRAVINCTVDGSYDGDIEWVHQGISLSRKNSEFERKKRLSAHSITIPSMTREDVGIYQCMAKNGFASSQASVRVLLGDTAAELQYTFIEQALRPGSPVSLRCSANGTPAPRFTWFLDNQPLKDLLPIHRFVFGQYVENTEEVVSHLNISLARSEDGGLYTCRAENSLGTVEHTARLNIYGPPYIRFIAPVRAVAGTNISIFCPYSGFPISKVLWERQGVNLSSYNRHHANLEGRLRIFNVNSGDSGPYTCSVISPSGELAKRDLQLIILKPPQLAPFVFPSNVEEGSNIQATCSVMSGDRPIFFSWLKDNLPIPAILEVEQRSVEFFSLLIIKEVTSAHSGLYTCIASNSASKANFSSDLIVRVAPHWIYEPQDTSSLMGTPIKIQCAARGFPVPHIVWMRSQGQSVENFLPFDLYDSRILENSTLYIKSVRPQDEGYYMCKATNDIGIGISKKIYITVNEPPRFDRGSRNVSVKCQDSATLVCEVFGDNPIRIVWTHNMKRLDVNNYRLIISEAKTETGMRSQLYIRQTERMDTGLYKCQAENTFGRSELVVNLAVQEKPDSPIGLEIVEVKSRMMKLGWRKPFSGNSPVLSYLIQYRPLQSSDNWDSSATVNITLPAKISTDANMDESSEMKEYTTISGLLPASSYILRILATNQIDQSAFSGTVIAKTFEEAPLEAPQNVRVEPSGPGELEVTWEAPSRDKWNGELLGYTISWQEQLQLANVQNNTKSTTISGWNVSKFVIMGLSTFTRYAVSLRAFNSISHGPTSKPILAITLEGVPESPPEDVACTSISSQSIKTSWNPPPILYRGGIILGYKVYYRVMHIAEAMEQRNGNEVKRTSGTETQLHALQPYTRYALQVRAFTAKGDGLLSHAIYCTTDEDAPGKPKSIKAISLSANAILISWLPPEKPNGYIKHYTIYVKDSARSNKHNTHLVKINETSQNVVVTSPEIMYTVTALNSGILYEFWVTATTRTGEGEKSDIVSQEPTERCPARIASFDGNIAVGLGVQVVLGCKKGGNPTPRTRWIRTDAPVTHHPSISITQNGDLHISKIDLSLADNFTCVARNSGGEDSITYMLRVLLPPMPPVVIGLPGTEYHSIQLKFDQSSIASDSTPAHGYIISYKRENEEWKSIEISSDSNTYTLENLKCGSRYHLYAIAYNQIGQGNPSNIVIVSTRGGVPKIPIETDFLWTNSTTLRMNMFTWEDMGCHISQFIVEYKQLGSNHWLRTNSEMYSDTMYITDLNPATWYQLKVAAANEAGRSVIDFNFATTTVDGVRIASPSNYPDDVMFPEDNFYDSIVLLVLCGIITVAVIIMSFFVLTKRRQETRNSDKPEDDNCRSCQQVYSALPVKTNGKIIDDISEMYEISPYATFSVGDTVGAQPSRAVTATTLDYTLQFRTFGHTENDDLNLPPPPTSSGYSNRTTRFKHKKRCYHSNTDVKHKPIVSNTNNMQDSDSEDCSAMNSHSIHRKPNRILYHADAEM